MSPEQRVSILTLKRKNLSSVSEASNLVLLFCFRESRLWFLRSPRSPLSVYKYERPNIGLSVNMEDFAQYKAQAKADLTRDTNLDKATDLVAERNVLLANPDIPDALKRAQLKQLNRQVWTWT